MPTFEVNNSRQCLKNKETEKFKVNLLNLQKKLSSKKVTIKTKQRGTLTSKSKYIFRK